MRTSKSGFSTLEVLVALLIIALVIVSAGRATDVILHVIGRKESSAVRGARARIEASTWIQAVTEYTRKQEFSSITQGCVPYPCSFWISQGGATVPYDSGPPLPRTFQCGRVLLRDWDGPGPVPPEQLLLMTVEVYAVRTSCTDGGTGSVFIAAHTGIAGR